MISLDEALERLVRTGAIQQLRELQSEDDIESAHSQADSILCNLLVGLGFSDVVEEWRKVRKWYA